MLNEILCRTDSIYRAYSDGQGICIKTHTYLEGDPINFRYVMEDDKFSKLVTPPVFTEWMANCTGDLVKAAPAIEALAKIYGVVWDREDLALVLRFRRNEMSVGKAIMRLQQAVAVISALGPM